MMATEASAASKENPRASSSLISLRTGTTSVAFHFHAMFLGFAQQVAAPRKVGDDHAHFVADEFWVNMLIGLRAAPHCRHMHAAFVRESRFAHKRQMLIGRDVGNFRDKMRKFI